jgi:hypothetical protein
MSELSVAHPQSENTRVPIQQTRPAPLRVLLGMLGLLLLLTFSNSLAANTLQASIDRDTISLQETFVLILRYNGQTTQNPDFVPLQKDFDILNTQQSNQMRIINGQMDSYTDWRIALAPKKSGVFTIPALQVAGATSQPLSITVEPQSQAPESASSAVFVDIETDKDNAYVQEQILVTIRLFTSVQLNSIELQPLELSDAVVVELDENQYQTTINGRPHAVVETRFAIFPQASGTLTLPSLTYQVVAGSGQRDLWNRMYGNRSNNLLRLRTEERTLQIDKVPDQFAGQPWLPASEISLSEHWSKSLDDFQVGEPVTRTLTVTAQGLTAGQIAPLRQSQINGLTFYPDQAQTDEQKTKSGVVGSRIETLAIVPTHSGRFTLPAVEVHWWDTTNGVMKTARLPETVIRVADNPFAEPAPAVESRLSAPTTEVRSALPGPAAVPAATTALPQWLLAVTGIVALLALVFAVLYWRARAELAAIYSLQREDKVQRQRAETSTWNRLKQASAKGDLVALRAAVLEWARVHWNQPNIHSLLTLAELTDNPLLQRQLVELDKALYSDAGKTWDSGELLQQIHETRRQQREKERAEEGLRPLYKN